ncbi:MAG TPA: hypothetical protein VIH86_12805, partial [Puia sp.]
VKKFVDFSFIGSVWKQFLAAIVMGLLVFFTGHMITSLVTLAIEAIIAGVVYIGFLFLISREEFMKMYTFIRASIKKEK